MAFSGNFMCTSFKVELLQGKHDFTNGQDQFKLALFTNSAEPTQGSFGGSGSTMNASVTDYSANNEVGNSGDYSAGGGTLTNVTPSASSTTALTDFSDKTYGSSTITARGAIIYNTQTAGGSSTTDAVLVLDFGGDKSSSSGDFQIVFPTADASNAIIRIA
tara:strand:- start:491 stop:973 length:483 start_codon:yes stop_codon:yes gene_type:complete